ncbi:MAG: alpha/beta hydrolase domain-containing protein, partial [Verrucomicrobiota bacterium]
TKATLTRRAAEPGAIFPIASADWAFADCRVTPFPGRPSEAAVSLRGGFDPAFLYELVYVAKDPPVLGIGLAATRDIVSFFRHESRDAAGAPNPLAARVRHVVAQGVSQSGNFTKTFLHLGFNEDESGRVVWDGVNVHVAGRQVPLNLRFALPGGAAGLHEPGSEGVLWWSPWPDATRGRPEPASLLDRARAAKVVPKIMETFGSAEFWSLRMSPGLVGTDAAADIPLPPEVRRYYFPGTAHGGGGGGFDTTPASAVDYLGLAGNPNPIRETHRALFLALIDWVAKDAEPPPSRYPRLDRGELVPPDAASTGFPSIPGAPLPDNLLNPFFEYDFGQGFDHADVSGVLSRQPPRIRRVLPSLVPRVDADGNEVGGAPSVLHQAPLGTYLGWSVAGGGFYRDRAAGFAASFIPFRKTRAERLAAGDPRPSLEERYGSRETYLERVREAAKRAVAEGLLLPEDAHRLVAQAEAGDVLRPLP